MPVSHSHILRDRSIAMRSGQRRIRTYKPLHVANTDESAHRYAISLDEGNRYFRGADLSRCLPLPSKASRLLPLPKRVWLPGSNKITFDIRAMNHEKVAVQEKTTFYMP